MTPLLAAAAFVVPAGVADVVAEDSVEARRGNIHLVLYSVDHY